MWLDKSRITQNGVVWMTPVSIAGKWWWWWYVCVHTPHMHTHTYIYLASSCLTCELASQFLFEIYCLMYVCFPLHQLLQWVSDICLKHSILSNSCWCGWLWFWHPPDCVCPWARWWDIILSIATSYICSFWYLLPKPSTQSQSVRVEQSVTISLCKAVTLVLTLLWN